MTRWRIFTLAPLHFIFQAKVIGANITREITLGGAVAGWVCFFFCIGKTFGNGGWLAKYLWISGFYMLSAHWLPLLVIFLSEIDEASQSTFAWSRFPDSNDMTDETYQHVKKTYLKKTEAGSNICHKTIDTSEFHVLLLLPFLFQSFHPTKCWRKLTEDLAAQGDGFRG